LEASNTTLGLTGMDDFLASSLVQKGRSGLESLLSLGNVFCLDSLTNNLDGVLDTSLGNTVTGATLQALTVPFQGGLVISQGEFS
jgi:hypothetical protein